MTILDERPSLREVQALGEAVLLPRRPCSGRLGCAGSDQTVQEFIHIIQIS